MVLDSTALMTFFPWLEPYLQQPGGLFIGRNGATGAPVLVDPFDQRSYANANIAVFGHSGAGKTYLLSTLAMAALGRGIQVYVIDPEHEYGGLAKEVGGVDVQLALGSGHALNVLDLKPSDRHDEAWLGPAAAAAVDSDQTQRPPPHARNRRAGLAFRGRHDPAFCRQPGAANPQVRRVSCLRDPESGRPPEL